MKNKILPCIIGIITGIANGFLGSGGGTVVVPCLEKFMKTEPHKAHATAIAIILPLTVISAFLYYYKLHVDLKTLGLVSIGGIAGGLTGAKLLNYSRSEITIMALIITGFLSGIIGGMGIGGGTILIPIMTIFLGFDQKTAQAVNLIYFIPTAITALTIHIKNKQIEKNNLWLLIVFGIIGTIIGTLCALKLDDTILRKCFSVFLLIVGAYEIYKGFKAKNTNKN